MPKPYGQWELMRPDELEAVLKSAPVAYVPLGTYEHHGWHLPVCFDGIKAHELCLRMAKRTGGVVLPTFFYGTGGGHIGYKWTIIVPETQIAPLIETTLDHLARFGFKVVALFTGHYAGEQVAMAHRLAKEASVKHPRTRFLAVTDPEVTTPLHGDTMGGDHAAKYETSIALALNARWVRMELLTEGRNPSQVTLPETPRREGTQYDPAHPLYAIWGQDPRQHASRDIGNRVVNEIVNRVVQAVEQALASG